MSYLVAAIAIANGALVLAGIYHSSPGWEATLWFVIAFGMIEKA